MTWRTDLDAGVRLGNYAIITDGKAVSVARPMHGGWWDSILGPQIKRPTHWQPFPEPPSLAVPRRPLWERILDRLNPFRPDPEIGP